MPPDPVKFLVVDALAGVQTFARQLLQGYGFSAEAILCCADTEAALAQGLGFKPDLLITDWFPKATLTGPALYERLRQAQPGLRLALLSFEVTPEHEAQARALGSHFLLKKPFTAEQLKQTLGSALDALAKDSPGLHARMTGTMNQAQPKGDLPRVVLPVLPVLPLLKPGDKIRYKGETLVIQYVVHRAGETAVQVKGRPELIPDSKFQRV